MNIAFLGIILFAIMYLASISEAETVRYTEDSDIFPNPERGWFIFAELKPDFSANENNWATDSLLRNYYSQGYRLAKHITIIPTNDSPIPESYLHNLQSEAALFRQNGFKVIYRFNYNWNHSFGNDDAPLDITLAHLDQLQPFFENNKDVLFAVEMGFIGYWGEMHHSTMGHQVPRTVGFTQSGKDIMAKILEVLPEDRFVSVRYPGVIYRNPESYGSLGFMTSLSEANAYNGSVQARLGGWQANFGGGKLWKNAPEYLQKWAPETRFVPQWAHCDYFQSESVKPEDWLEEAQMFHYVALSNPKDEKHLQDMYGSWIQQGAYDVFARKLGYRLRLISASVEDQVKSGNKFSIQLDMTNDGWTSPTNPRILEIVMRNLSSGKEYLIRFRPKEDLRLWLSGPGQQKKLTIDSIIPATLPLDQYSILLNLPDPEPRLYDDPRYKIRLASIYDGSSIWEPSTGYNNLHLNVTIEP